MENITNILSVFAPIFAICVAIWIPKRIADRQDKIALFEKRYELYKVFRQLDYNIRVIPLDTLFMYLAIQSSVLDRVRSTTGWLFDEIINVSRNDSEDKQVKELGEEFQLKEFGEKFPRALDEFDMVKYIFVLNKEEINKIEKIRSTFLAIWYTAKGMKEEQLIKNKEDLLPLIKTEEDLLPLKEISSIVKSLEKQLYLINPTLNKSN